MDIYKINDIAELIKDNSYVGRGIVIGKTDDGSKACAAYFIMISPPSGISLTK